MTRNVKPVVYLFAFLAGACCAGLILILYTYLLNQYLITDSKALSYFVTGLAVGAGSISTAFIVWNMAKNDVDEFHRQLHRNFLFDVAVDERLAVLAQVTQDASLAVIDLQQKLALASLEEEKELKEKLGLAEAQFRAAHRHYWDVVRLAQSFGLNVLADSFKQYLPKEKKTAA